MLDIKWIRENQDAFAEAMQKRKVKGEITEKLMSLDEDKRQLTTIIQKLKQARNEKAKIIAELTAKNPHADLVTIKKDASDIKDKVHQLEQELNSNEGLNSYLSTLPNIPDITVPVGEDELDNVEIKKVGNIPHFDFKPKQHFELGESLGMIDFVDSAKMSGSRFVTLKKDIAKLERALANFMIDLHTSQFDFQEISPPYLVKDSAMYNAGQLPKFADDSYATDSGLRLIPTAEVPLLNYFADKILQEEDLPIRYVAHTPCFRLEAGSAGKDTKGMLRQHQFSKVELVSIATPEQAEEEHEKILAAAEEVLVKLGLPYKVMLLSTGDMGFSAKKTYDIEVWMAGQNTYREISSCSNCGDFQARRMKGRFKRENVKENITLHTLNGSGLAIGRTIIAILENNQNKDGSITIPEALVPYMGGQTVIK